MLRCVSISDLRWKRYTRTSPFGKVRRKYAHAKKVATQINTLVGKYSAYAKAENMTAGSAMLTPHVPHAHMSSGLSSYFL